MCATSSDLAGVLYYAWNCSVHFPCTRAEIRRLTKRNTVTKEKKDDRENKIRGMFAVIIGEVGR